MKVFSSVDKSWTFPKMFHMLRYSEDIREYGTITIGNTGPREQQNKQIKQASRRTRLGSSGFKAKVHNFICMPCSASLAYMLSSEN